VSADPRGLRFAERLPSWMGSIRFRIALLYSTLLFGLAAVMLGAIYIGLAHSLDDQPIYRRYQVTPVPGGVRIQAEDVRTVEQVVNAQTLDNLRRYSFAALAGLFVTSLGVGWVVAGRALRPIERITSVARDIQATDLSRRIDLGGPPDELRDLADTFDDMLTRIDDAFESQRQFIHEASHELRNPLAVIRTNLEVTLGDPDASAAELRRTAEIVERSTERMARLVDDLLVYARRGTLSLERAPLDASLLVNEAVDEFRAPAEARLVRLIGESEPGLWVEGDRLALRQALANLLANAVRLSPEGTTIRVSAGREAPWIWLAVQDQGPGIDPADQERVFQRFWRGDPAASRTEGRSGLGLTIVRQIAEAHGGEVKLVSEPGRGAAFAVWLPAAATSSEAASPTGASPAADSPAASGRPVAGDAPAPPT